MQPMQRRPAITWRRSEPVAIRRTQPAGQRAVDPRRCSRRRSTRCSSPSSSRRLRPAPHRRHPADDPGQRLAAPARRVRQAQRRRTPRCWPAPPLAASSGAASSTTRSSTSRTASPASPASGSTSTCSATPAARSSGPSRTRSSRWTSSACPTRSPASPTCPAAWCWSPARPVRARRPPSPRSSTWPTAAAPSHIVTIEDPIEFLHPHKRSLVNQREVGADTEHLRRARSSTRCARTRTSSWSASCATWRPPSTALTAAETGHLVLATLHTQSATQTIDRVIDIFPPHQQLQIRAQLSTALQGVVTQALAPRADGKGRRGRRRDPDRHAGHPQPDPRGQDPPDPLVHAGRRQRRACSPSTSTWPRRSASSSSPTSRRLELCHSAEELKRLVGTDVSRCRPPRPSTTTASTRRRQASKGTVEAPNETAATQTLRQQGADAARDRPRPARGLKRGPADPGPRRPGQAQGPGGLRPAVRHDDRVRACRCCARWRSSRSRPPTPR